MTQQEHIEQECLKETRAALPSNEILATKFAHRVHQLKLEGTYPDTKIVVTGEYTYGGTWRVSFPIWDPGTGGTRDGQPVPSFIGMLVYTEVLEA